MHQKTSCWIALAFIIFGIIFVVIGLVLGFSGNSKCNQDNLNPESQDSCQGWLIFFFLIGFIAAVIGVIWLAVLLCAKPHCHTEKHCEKKCPLKPACEGNKVVSSVEDKPMTLRKKCKDVNGCKTCEMELIDTKSGERVGTPSSLFGNKTPEYNLARNSVFP